jgi:hypothetical protein
MAVADPDKVFAGAGVGQVTKGKGIQQFFYFLRFIKMHKGKYKPYFPVDHQGSIEKGIAGVGILFEKSFLKNSLCGKRPKANDGEGN